MTPASPRSPDLELDRLVAGRLTRQQVEPGEACLDAEVLASYADDGLPAVGRTEVEAHLATCAWCRRALAVMMDSAASVEAVGTEAEAGAGAWAATVAAAGLPGAAAPSKPASWSKTMRSTRTWLPMAATVLVAAGLWFVLRTEREAIITSTSDATRMQTSLGGAAPAAGPSGAAGVASAPPPTAQPAPQSARQPTQEPSPAVAPTTSASPAPPASSGPPAASARADRTTSAADSARERADAGGAGSRPTATAAPPPTPAPGDQVARERPTFRTSVPAPAPESAQPRQKAADAQAPPPAANQVADSRATQAESNANQAQANASQRQANANQQTSGPMQVNQGVPSVPPANERTPTQDASAAQAKVGTDIKVAAGSGAAAPAPARPANEPATVAAASPPTRDSVLRSPTGARWWRIRAPSTIEGSADRGATWTVEFSDPTAHIVRGVVASNDGCWMIGENGLVLRLRSGTGAGWLRVTPPSTRPLVSVAAVDDRIATIADDSGRRYRTTDGGQTWQVVQP